MKKYKSMFHGLMIVLTVGLIGAAITGCQTHLATGGAYAPGIITLTTNADGSTTTTSTATGAPDLALYQADTAFSIGYATFTAVSDYERANRAALWKISPSIKHTLDTYRPQAADVYFRWGMAREAYLQNRIPANLTILNQLVDQITSITQAVQAGTTLTLKTP